VSHVTTAFLTWVGALLKAEGKKALRLVWDNASWHVSKEVRSWVRAPNRQAKREGGVQILVCQLPVKSPWLNRIEPKWVYAKRAVAEPDRLLSKAELIGRICSYFTCKLLSILNKRSQKRSREPALACTTAEIPPQPSAAASVAAHYLRILSSVMEARDSYLVRTCHDFIAGRVAHLPFSPTL
jgi:hypothetical protein